MNEKESNERESELKSGLNNLGAAVNDLRAIAKELAGKLSPVMREIQATPTGEQSESQYSPIGQQIGVITITVNETGDRLQEIMRHLEV